MDYLSLCLICKDENDYLAEWLDYHILVGVDRFYIYDNESRVSLRETLKDYVERGWVIVMDIPGKAMQLHAYDHCLRTFGSQTFWLGFIDTDEFFVPKACLNLKDFLKDYEDYGAMAVSSLFFGTGGHKDRPAAGQLPSYLLRTHETFQENKLIKCFVRPDQVMLPNSPHDFVYKPTAWCVNEDFKRIDYQRFPNSIKKIQVNHYYCRSESEIELKMKRGNAGDLPWTRLRFSQINKYATFIDRTILDLLEQVVSLQDPAGRLTGLGLLEKMATLARKRSPTPFSSNVPDRVVLHPQMIENIALRTLVGEAQERNDLENIEPLYKQMLQDTPHKVTCYTDLMWLYLLRGQPDPAWQFLAQAWRLAPNTFFVLLNMTQFFLRVGNFVMAEKTARLLLEEAPHDLQALGFLADALMGLDRYEEGLKVGIPTIELAARVGELPEKMSVNLVKKMADYLLQKKEYQQAVNLWEAGLACVKDDVNPVLELVQILLQIGNYSRAQQWLLVAQKLEPQNQVVQKLLRQVKRKHPTAPTY